MKSFYIIIKYITPFCPLAYLYSVILFGISTSYALLTITQNVVFSIMKCKKWFCSLLDDLRCSHLHLNKHNISHGDSRCCVLMHDKHYVAIGSLLHTLLFLCLTVQWIGGVTQSLLYGACSWVVFSPCCELHWNNPFSFSLSLISTDRETKTDWQLPSVLHMICKLAGQNEMQTKASLISTVNSVKWPMRWWISWV